MQEICPISKKILRDKKTLPVHEYYQTTIIGGLMSCLMGLVVYMYIAYSELNWKPTLESQEPHLFQT